MTNKCDQCNKQTEVKLYFWSYKGKEGGIQLCEDCYKSIKSEGYELERE